MLRALGDPYIVRRFQNLCGLTEVCSSHQSAARVTDTNISNGINSTRFNNNRILSEFRRQHFTKNGPKILDKEVKEQVQNKNVTVETEFEYNFFFHALFTFGTALGYELFYITFFPFIFWIIDEFIGRRVVFFWAFSMYCGQAAKDVIQWSRPPCPPVLAVEKHLRGEYGMPSTHAVSGSIIPFVLLFYSYGRYQYPLAVGVMLAICWTTLVCSSRLYMGMHTLQDILAGIAITALVLAVFIPLIDAPFEQWVLTTPSTPIFLLAISLTMVILYPDPSPESGPQKGSPETRAQTTMILAVAVGGLLASWLRFSSIGIVTDSFVGTPFPVTFPGIDRLLNIIARFVLGLAVLMPTKVVMKSLVHFLVPVVLGRFMKTEKKERKVVKLIHMFVTYGIVSFNAVYAVPLCFWYFGI